MRKRRGGSVVVFVLSVLAACTNNPYPDSDAERKILYSSFVLAARELDLAWKKS